MTTIDFYTHCADRFEVASKLVAKAWAQHGTVRVLTDSARATDEFGRFLWLWPATGFLPHCQLGSPLAAETPIVVDHALEHEGPAAVLVNLHAVPPPFFSRFERLAEIVSLDEAEIAAGRERWKFYKARGYEIRSFNLAARAVAMASARELLEQADALMRRNRAGVIDTEIPELRDMIAMVAPARRPRSSRSALDDVPELTEAVEEIEIESIVELPEDIDESSGWLHHDHGELSVVGKGPDEFASPEPRKPRIASGRCRARAARALAVVAQAAPAVGRRHCRGRRLRAVTPVETPAATPCRSARIASPRPSRRSRGSAGAARGHRQARREPQPRRRRLGALGGPRRRDSHAGAAADRHLHRDALARPAERASCSRSSIRPAPRWSRPSTTHVGGLLRAYIAEAIEREIEKWRGAAR